MTNFLDLFSGIGGFSLGAYWAGLRFDNHYFSEVDPYAVKIYQQRFPDAVPLGDITKIYGQTLVNADRGRYLGIEEIKGTGIREVSSKRGSGDWILAGGFPC